MNEKKNTAKFTIQFNPNVATHLKAIKILNSMPPRSKAQIITDALLMYNSAYGIVDITNTDDIIINLPAKNRTQKKNTTVNTTPKTEDSSLILEYDEDDYSEDDFIDDEGNDGEYDSVLARSLMGMSFNVPESGD